MAKGPRYKVPFRRRREGKTDYRHRANLLKGEVPRAVVRITNTQTIIQIVDFHMDGDRVLASAVSRELLKMGWKGAHSNTTASYLTGYIAGKRALKAGVEEAVLDIGLKSKVHGSKTFAAMKGMVDAGLYVPHDDSVLPAENRLNGEAFGEAVASSFKAVMSKLESE